MRWGGCGWVRGGLGGLSTVASSCIQSKRIAEKGLIAQVVHRLLRRLLLCVHTQSHTQNRLIDTDQPPCSNYHSIFSVALCEKKTSESDVVFIQLMFHFERIARMSHNTPAHICPFQKSKRVPLSFFFYRFPR